MRILHIDKDKEAQEVADIIFQQIADNIEMHYVNTASEAVEQLNSEEFDCIICDYQLPDADGLELLDSLRTEGNNLPFVILTEHGNEEIAAEALRKGADDYYTKSHSVSTYRRMLANIQHIMDRKKTQPEEETISHKVIKEAGTDQNSLLVQAFDAIHQPIIVYSCAKGSVDYCNSAFQELFGFEKHEIINGSLQKIFFNKYYHEDFIQYVKDNISDTGHYSTRINLMSKSGEVRFVELIISEFRRDDDAGNGWTIVFNDRSQDKIMELAFQRHTSVMEKRIEQLLSAKEEFKEFTYSVSHDLKAPIRHVIQFAGLLRKSELDLDSESNRLVKKIIKSAQTAESLLEGLMSFSKASYSEILWETVDLSIIAKSIIMNLKAGHPERDVDFVVYPNLVAKCDPALLHSVIQNLLNNAWKFTEKTEKAKIIFGAMYGDQEQIFYIQDNGVGFDPKYADKLFVPFQRLHDKDQYTGTGLGLSIVKKIIDRHGGNIWAESEPDKGATFFFTLKQNTPDKK